MTTCEFVRENINFDNPVKDIPRNYPEISVMYHIFSGLDKDIFANTDENGTIRFSILCDNADEAHRMKEKVHQLRYQVYGINYIINAKVRKSTVFITMIK